MSQFAGLDPQNCFWLRKVMLPVVLIMEQLEQNKSCWRQQLYSRKVSSRKLCQIQNFGHSSYLATSLTHTMLSPGWSKEWQRNSFNFLNNEQYCQWLKKCNCVSRVCRYLLLSQNHYVFLGTLQTPVFCVSPGRDEALQQYNWEKKKAF